MTTVRRLLDAKGTEIWTTTPAMEVYDALRLMAEKNVGALVVVEGDAPVGIFSERDYARKVALKGHTSRELTVREVMSTSIVTVATGDSIEDCMALMTDYRIRHLPVVENGRLLGMISIGDVVKAMIDEQRSTITHLNNYITGRR